MYQWNAYWGETIHYAVRISSLLASFSKEYSMFFCWSLLSDTP